MKYFEDLEIISEVPERLDFRSDSVFTKPDNKAFSEFMMKVFSVQGVTKVRLNSKQNSAAICYDSKQTKWKEIIQNIFSTKSLQRNNGTEYIYNWPSSISYPELNKKEICFGLHGNLITNWEVLQDIPGRLRIKNLVLLYRKGCCEDLQKSLSDIIGVDKVKINSLTGSILIIYNERAITRDQLIEISDNTLKAVPDAAMKIEKPSIQGLPLSTLGMGLSLVPGLGVFTVPLTIYTGWPIFMKATSALKQKKIKVDILDATVVTMCLVFRQYGAAAFMVWILDAADLLLEKTSKHSKGLLDKVFGQQARNVWVLRDGMEIQVPIEKIIRGDTVVVSIGEQIPIDGKIIDGDGVVDQHMLTGESAPIEKKINDKVLACTTLLAGKIYIEVEEAGKETTASKIADIIKKSAEYKPKVMSFGERMADKAVIPTLALGAAGMATGGPGAMMAIINADFGTGIRVAAPTAVLAHLSKALRSGMVIKKGSALETLNNIDTFVFDKTGTLTQDSLEVKNVITLNGVSSEQIISYAACAEHRFTHPIAKAIIEKSNELNLKMPKDDEREYCAGLGIKTVINGDTVRVGSLGFMDKESIKIDEINRKKVVEMYHNAICPVLVSLNGHVSGIIELHSSERPESYDVIQNLRKRGVKNLVLLSGDNEAPTRILAKKLGMDYYFAEVLPQDKSNFVRGLQERGSKVAMVGDGINDGAALSLADISISLKGASDVAIDSADVIFMDGNLTKLDKLYEVSLELKKSLDRSFKIIVIPNVLCIAGALLGIVGIGTSLVLNNVFNMVATAQATAPLYATEKKPTPVVQHQLEPHGK